MCKMKPHKPNWIVSYDDTFFILFEAGSLPLFLPFIHSIFLEVISLRPQKVWQVSVRSPFKWHRLWMASNQVFFILRFSRWFNGILVLKNVLFNEIKFKIEERRHWDRTRESGRERNANCHCLMSLFKFFCSEWKMKSRHGFRMAMLKKRTVSVWKMSINFKLAVWRASDSVGGV